VLVEIAKFDETKNVYLGNDRIPAMARIANRKEIV